MLRKSKVFQIGGAPECEDFTDFTVVDVPEDRIQVTEDHVDHEAGNDETTYCYRDKGAGYFGSNWEHLVDIRSDTTLDAVSSYQSVVYMCADVAKDWGIQAGSIMDDGDNCVDIRLYRGILLEEVDGGTEYNDCSSFYPQATTWYYLRIKKVGTALTCKIYDTAASRDAETSDEHLLDTLSLTLHEDYTFRYIFGCSTVNTGGERWFNTDIENLCYV